MNTKSIYLDHSATTPVDPRVVDAMLPYFTEKFGNASSLHRWGQTALTALDESRQAVAEILNANPKEIVFTSGGSESDNLALRGVAMALRAKGAQAHIITTPIEHHAILNTTVQLEKEFGFEVTRVPVDRQGRVNPDDVARAITPKTALISVMYANNEVGTIEPLVEIAKIVKDAKSVKGHEIYLHTDAVQAGGYLPLDVNKLGVDLMSLGAHKFHGPKGVGVLYVRNGTPMLPMQTGGSHERNRRAGTENIPYIVGFATALKIAQSERESTNARLISMREKLVEGILERVAGAQLTGDPKNRLPGHASLVIPGAVGDEMVLGLDLAGIAASTGSACTAGSLEPSHVLAAMGYTADVARGALRLTLGRENTDEEIDYAVNAVADVVHKLRRE
ncbi:MAG: cysteine desulfurase [Chloroflexi bacterium]|nr:cysteine desulfurase [Chloroflexota bacterium]